MRKASYFVACLIVFWSSANAQLRKAADYFPLQVGNIWQHQRADGFGAVVQSEVISSTLLGDTLIVYTTLFKAFQEPPSEGVNYYYYNLDSTIVYRHFDGTFPERPYLYPSNPLLNASGGLGGRWKVFLGDITGIAAITDTGTVSFFGEKRKWLEVNLIEERGDSIEISPGYHFRFVEGIGITREGIDTLIYARIAGKDYGTPATKVREAQQFNPLPVNFNIRIYPNPAQAKVTFFLESLPGGPIDIAIHDIMGRKVRGLELNSASGATRQLTWDGRNAENQLVAGGIYFVTVKVGHLLNTQKFIFLPGGGMK